ncbi:MAG TPA: methyltransferase domain-containing protein [Acidimicrobiales bacterium]|nr:methyltransferase domain-containing protein [Acidimicrobiales bacterium]
MRRSLHLPSPSASSAPPRSPAGREPIRLNLGSGPDAVPGWHNLDRSPNILLDRLPLAKAALRKVGLIDAGHMAAWSKGIRYWDARRGLPYEDGTVEAVYSSHTLEHMYLDVAEGLLAECRRVLRPGGRIRLALPDGEQIARALVEDGSAEAARRYNEALAAAPAAQPPRTRLSHLVSGAYHRWQPTYPLVREMLEDVGFVACTRRQYRDGELPDLAAVETRPESFFIEATVGHDPSGPGGPDSP